VCKPYSGFLPVQSDFGKDRIQMPSRENMGKTLCN